MPNYIYEIWVNKTEHVATANSLEVAAIILKAIFTELKKDELFSVEVMKCEDPTPIVII